MKLCWVYISRRHTGHVPSLILSSSLLVSGSIIYSHGIFSTFPGQKLVCQPLKDGNAFACPFSRFIKCHFHAGACKLFEHIRTEHKLVASVRTLSGTCFSCSNSLVVLSRPWVCELSFRFSRSISTRLMTLELRCVCFLYELSLPDSCGRLQLLVFLLMQCVLRFHL